MSLGVDLSELPTAVNAESDRRGVRYWFLSCLSGSEYAVAAVVAASCFLSCLSGSECHKTFCGTEFAFLSCLSGSEWRLLVVVPCGNFLSCLSGSE